MHRLLPLRSLGTKYIGRNALDVVNAGLEQVNRWSYSSLRVSHDDALDGIVRRSKQTSKWHWRMNVESAVKFQNSSDPNGLYREDRNSVKSRCQFIHSLT
jgi:hypothetical protein